ncbi:50S ribosomal protein L9 [Candidatus Peribacteria bacterium RIFCSPHIGHO2_01_FULL_51_9]|nr:MAG: 50S ribosomal protein L9 [Candidatus Peribacteria bacterium RIFCSPHIGHO2_01_FULL_51_9]
MEVLLLQDIAGVGKKNDLLAVGDGFALNFLLPQRQALVATPTVRRRYAEEIRKRAEEREREKQMKTDLAQGISGKEVRIARKVTKTGKLYAAVSEKVIAEELKKQHSLAVDPSAIQISDPLKMTGVFEVTLKLGQREEKIKVIVEAEKE